MQPVPDNVLQKGVPWRGQVPITASWSWSQWKPVITADAFIPGTNAGPKLNETTGQQTGVSVSLSCVRESLERAT